MSEINNYVRSYCSGLRRGPRSMEDEVYFGTLDELSDKVIFFYNTYNYYKCLIFRYNITYSNLRTFI